MNLSFKQDKPTSLSSNTSQAFKKIDPKIVFKSQICDFSKPQRIKGFPMSAGQRSSSISPMYRQISTEQGPRSALSSRRLERELREINTQLRDENFPPRINSTFDSKSLIKNKFKLGADAQNQCIENSNYNEIEYLNDLCNHLIEEQSKLKEKLAKQENIIEGMKSKTKISNHPLKLFQVAVSQLEEERKVRHMSAKRSSTQRERSTMLNKNSAFKENIADLSLNLDLIGIKKIEKGENDELFTFRPRSPATPNKGAFPREVFRKMKTII